MKKWLVAFIATVTCVVSLGLLAAPVGAASTSTTTVSDNAPVVFGGTLIFTATVAGSGVTPTGTLTWTVTDPLGNPVTCPDPAMLDSGGKGTCTIASALVGAYSATVTYGGDGNYSGSFNSDPAGVGPAPQAALIVTSTAGTYGTPLPLTTSGGSGTGVVTYAVANGTALGCAVSILDQLTSTSAGTCVVTATKAADANYNLTTSAPATVTLAPLASTTTVTDNASTVVTGGTLVFAATVGPSGIPLGTVAWTGVTCSSVTPLTAGVATCSIANAQASIAYGATATFTDADGNFSGSSGSLTAGVGKATPATPTITNLPGSGTFGGGFTAVVVTTTIGSGTTSVTSSTPAVCAASGLSVSYVGIGTCSLNAQVAANVNFSAASGGAQSFNIGRANATTPVISNIPSPANEFRGLHGEPGDHRRRHDVGHVQHDGSLQRRPERDHGLLRGLRDLLADAQRRAGPEPLRRLGEPPGVHGEGGLPRLLAGGL